MRVFRSEASERPACLSIRLLLAVLLGGCVVRVSAEGQPTRGGVRREEWRVVVVLEPNCPVKIDVDLESRCMAAAMGGNWTLPSWCPNYGLGSQEKEHPSWSVTVPPYDNCYRGKAHYKSAYTSMFRRIIPILKQHRWAQVTAVNFGESAQLEQREALEAADVIICTTKHYRLLRRQRPCALHVLIAPDDPATLERGLDFNHPGILAVLQHTSVQPLALNNELPVMSRRSFKGSGHPQDPVHFKWMAPGGHGITMTARCPSLSASTLEKVHPLVPQLLRFRYPLDCGGSFGSLLLQGFFSKGRPPTYLKPLSQRAIDVMYVGASHQRSGSLLRDHRQAVVAILNSMKVRHPHMTIKTPGRLEPQQYATMLRDAKLFVSPFGLGEFSGKDYEAVLAGCLLVKPLANRIVAYPNIYKASATVGVQGSFQDLEARILEALRNLPSSQAMVDAQTQQLDAHDVEIRKVLMLMDGCAHCQRLGVDVSNLLDAKLSGLESRLNGPEHRHALPDASGDGCIAAAAPAGVPRPLPGDTPYAGPFRLRLCRQKVPYGRAARWFRQEKYRLGQRC